MVGGEGATMYASYDTIVSSLRHIRNYKTNATMIRNVRGLRPHVEPGSSDHASVIHASYDTSVPLLKGTFVTIARAQL